MWRSLKPEVGLYPKLPRRECRSLCPTFLYVSPGMTAAGTAASANPLSVMSFARRLSASEEKKILMPKKR